MPNYCECDLRVEGKVATLEKFKSFMHAPTHYSKEMVWLSEDKLTPYPERFSKLDAIRQAWEMDAKQRGEVSWVQAPKDGFNSGGYEWCIENWGTKWGFGNVIDEPTLEVWGEDGELVYHFKTAWSPPLPLIRKMGELFTDLDFDLRYFEAGMQFNGVLKIKHGVETEDEKASISAIEVVSRQS